jgi:hypothetical protein
VRPNSCVFAEPGKLGAAGLLIAPGALVLAVDFALALALDAQRNCFLFFLPIEVLYLNRVVGQSP